MARLQPPQRQRRRKSPPLPPPLQRPQHPQRLLRRNKDTVRPSPRAVRTPISTPAREQSTWLPVSNCNEAGSLKVCPVYVCCDQKHTFALPIPVTVEEYLQCKRELSWE